MEIWKDITGFENLYQVSNLGNVRRIKYFDNSNKATKKVPFLLKKRIDKDGYYKVTLINKNIRKNVFCHRLVAIEFIDNPLNKKQVNHKDGIKNNNDINNLEWVSQSENRIHCLKYLKPKLRNNKSSKKVYQYDSDLNFIKEYPSAKEAGRENCFSQGHISEVCRGEVKRYKGFIWSYDKINNV